MGSAEYVPYGPEWAKEVARLPKARLVEMLRQSGLERDRLRDALAKAREWARMIHNETSAQVIADMASYIWGLADMALGDVATAGDNERGTAPNPKEVTHG